eukprot:COSAG02_NODE_6049_length_3845_cov_1.807528_3_plen_119_part_00
MQHKQLTIEHRDALLSTDIQLWARAVIGPRVIDHSRSSRAGQLHNMLVDSSASHSRNCIHLDRRWIRIEVATKNKLRPETQHTREGRGRMQLQKEGSLDLGATGARLEIGDCNDELNS